MEVLKPYLLLACVAFFVGFAGYLAVGRMLSEPMDVRQDSPPAAIAASAPDVALADSRPV